MKTADKIDTVPKLHKGRAAVHGQALRELRTLTGLSLEGLATQLQAEGVGLDRSMGALRVVLNVAELGETNLDAVLLEQTCLAMLAQIPSENEAPCTYQLGQLLERQVYEHMSLSTKQHWFEADAPRLAGKLRAIVDLAEGIKAEGSPLVEQAELIVEQMEALVLAAVDSDAERLERELAPSMEIVERLDADVAEARMALVASGEPAATRLGRLIAAVPKT